MSVQITRRQIKDGIINNAKIDASAAIESTKLANWSADRNAGGYKLTGLANGTAATDAVTKAQLDAVATASAAGLAVKAPVRVASTGNIAGSYDNDGGTSLRGQLTGMPNAVDGVSLASNDRVLLKNQTAQDSNGIWVVSTLGTGSDGVWDRATDFDSDAEVTDGTFVFVGEGTANAATQWVLTTNESITVGGASGSSLVFTQFGAGTSYTADNVTLELNADEFSIKDAGVGTDQLAADAVTNAKLADNAVQTENILNDAVTQDKIADDAVGSAQLATNSVTDDAIADGAVGTDALAADAVTNAKLADNAVQQENLADNSVGTAEIIDANVTAAKLASEAVTGPKIKFIAQTVTGDVDGVNDDFVCSSAPTAGSLIVWVNGMRQRPTTDYTLATATITFTTPPEIGDDIAVFGVAAS